MASTDIFGLQPLASHSETDYLSAHLQGAELLLIRPQ